jgi:hypothetical protein
MKNHPSKWILISSSLASYLPNYIGANHTIYVYDQQKWISVQSVKRQHTANISKRVPICQVSYQTHRSVETQSWWASWLPASGCQYTGLDGSNAMHKLDVFVFHHWECWICSMLQVSNSCDSSACHLAEHGRTRPPQEIVPEFWVTWWECGRRGVQWIEETKTVWKRGFFLQWGACELKPVQPSRLVISYQIRFRRLRIAQRSRLLPLIRTEGWWCIFAQPPSDFPPPPTAPLGKCCMHNPPIQSVPNPPM